MSNKPKYSDCNTTGYITHYHRWKWSAWLCGKSNLWYKFCKYCKWRKKQ